MFREITLGQYYPADSILHRLDPRVKFIGTILYIVSLFLFRNWGYLLGIGFLVFLIVLSKVPFRFIVKGLRPILFLLIFTMVLNIFLTPGTILWQWKVFHITQETLSVIIKKKCLIVAVILFGTIIPYEPHTVGI